MNAPNSHESHLPSDGERQNRWIFTKEQLTNTPSIRRGYTCEKELSERQWAANFILEMGRELKLSQCCMNTAIVYMHRFYMFHSFQKFPRVDIATCSLFLAAKVEEAPKRLEHIINTAYIVHLKTRTAENLTAQSPSVELLARPDPQSKEYQETAQKLVANENLLLQTLGFEMKLDHPHASIITCCQLVRASKELTHVAYNFATLSLQLTTLCLLYKPSIVACVCIHVACKWSKVEIPPSVEGKGWWHYVDQSVTIETIDGLAREFTKIIQESPTKYRSHVVQTHANTVSNNYSGGGGSSGSSGSSGSCGSSGSSGSCASSMSGGSGSGAVNSGGVVKKIKLEK